MTVTKLQVDVLVHAAMFGPMEAADWTPMVKDPDELGRELLSSGRRASGERNAEDYVFEPLPIAITAVEAIKACSYYRYNRSKANATVSRISSSMTHYLEGAREAPWGWTSDDIAARRDRPAPRSEVPAPPPLALTKVGGQLAEIGVEVGELIPTVTADVDYQVGGTGKFHGVVRASFVEEHPGRRFHSNLIVLVAKNSETAHRAFPHAVERIVWKGARFTDVRQIGNIVISADVPPRTDRWPEPDLVTALDQLGSPEQHWSQDEPPLESGPGELVVSRVEMALHHPVVATSKADLERVLDCLTDSDVKEQLRQVDLRHHSVLATPGWEIGKVVGVELVRAAAGEPARMNEDLVVTFTQSDKPPITTGSIVLTPRLKRRPGYVRLTWSASNRFHGMWKNVASLRSRKR